MLRPLTYSSVSEALAAAPLDRDRVQAEVVARLDVRAEFQALDVVFTGRSWGDRHECYGPDREEPGRSVASAVVFGDTGWLHDSGSGKPDVHLFNFAVQRGRFARWRLALEHYADKAGVALPPFREKQGEILERTFDYRRPDGSTSYRVYRYITATGDKTFRQRGLMANGNPRFDAEPMKGVEPLPYGLDRFPAVDDALSFIFITEGEKACEALWSIGLDATTAHGGAGSARKNWPAIARHFAGRDAVVLPDNDDNGRKYARAACEALRGVAASVRCLELPGLPPKGDAVEWVAAGGTAGRLAELADATPVWEPSADGPAAGAQELEPAEDFAYRKARLGIVCLEDIEVRPIRWLWDQRIPLGKITLLGGEGEIGKTYAVCDLIARITTGRPFPGDRSSELGPRDCIFVTAEDGMGDTIKPRLLAMGADCSRVHTITTGIGPDGKMLPFSLADIPRLQETIDVLPDTALIAVDPIASFVGRVDENKNAELRTVLGPLSEFADQRSVSLLAITHFGKNPTARGVGRILGSVAYSNAARAVWCVVADPENPDRRLMLRGKNNLSPVKTGFAYIVIDQQVVWEDTPLELRLDDVLAAAAAKYREGGPAAGRSHRTDECAAWLLAELSSGPRRIVELGDRGKAEHDYSIGTIYNARDRINAGGEWSVMEVKNPTGRGKIWLLSPATVQMSTED